MLTDKKLSKSPINFKYFKSIQMQILIYISILIICIIFFLYTVFYYLSSRVITKDTQDYTGQITEQLGSNIEYYVNYMKDISYILNDEALNYSKPNADQKDETNKNNLLLKTISQVRSDITSMYVFQDNKIILTDQDEFKVKKSVDIKEADWYKNAIKANGNPAFSAPHVENLKEGKYPWVVSLSKAIYKKDSTEVIGVSLIDINFKVFTDICSKVQLGKSGYVFIVDDKGNTIYHPKQELIYSNIKTEPMQKILETENGNFSDMSDGTERLMTVKSIHSIGWKVVGVTYMKDILIQRKDYMSVMNIIILLCLVLATVISIKIARNISNPLSKLERIMKKVETGEMDIEIDISGNSEIAHLSQTFSVMVKRIKNLLVKIEEDQSELRKSELKALYSQINPHFLYNSLDTIIWAAEQNENDKVVRMTSALAKYFRLSVTKEKEVIPIYQEIDHIKNYLIIQKIRYDQKLQYEIEVDDDIKMYRTIKILMQPIVENAIYHGIKNSPDGGKIWVTGKKEGNIIHLVVRDNGKGMSEDQLKSILEKKEDENPAVGGVGIKNVHQRIQLYYGSNYGLRFESELGYGTTVTIIIPVVE